MDPNPFRRRSFRWPWRSKSDVRADVEAELQFHLDMRAEELVRRGLTPDAAHREARAHFGDLTGTRQFCIDQDTRTEDRLRRKLMLDELRQDIRIGSRRLWKTRAVAGVTLVTLALGIGANTAVFSLVNAALLRPLPYRDAGRLVLFYEGVPKADLPKLGVSPADYLDLARDQRSCDTLGVYGNGEVELGGEGASERVWTAAVSPSTFKVLGVAPALGRAFVAAEDRPDADVVVIGHGLWQRRFGGRPDVLGRTIAINRHPHAIVGVMPRGFEFPLAGLPFNGHAAELWTPLSFSAAERQVRGGMYHHGVIGRLAPGRTIADARAELPVLVERIFSNYPVQLRNSGLRLVAQVVPLRDEAVGDIRLPLLVLLAAGGLVLLVACANVANLLLSRAAAREHEVVVMAALGASRGRLRQMLLTESAILGLLSGAVGLAVAWVITTLAPLALPDRLASLGDVSPDGRVLTFTFALSLLTSLVFGLIPAGITSRADLQSALRTTGRVTAGRQRRFLQQGLVVATVALAAVLLVGAGLLTRSFAALVATDAGIRADRVLTASVSLPAAAYSDGARVRAFFHQALDRLKTLPGVEHVSGSTDLPLAGREHLAFTAEASPIERARLPQSVAVTWPMGDYFQTFGIPLKRGRVFDARDREGSQPVVIVSQAFAHRVWPGQDAVGKRLKWGIAESPMPWMTVVGVVGDVKEASLDASTFIHAYEPHDQQSVYQIAEAGEFFRTLEFAVRTSSDPLLLAGALRAEFARLDPALAISDLGTMDARLSAATSPQRMSAVLMLAFAAAALLMAAVGIYGILAYTVAQRAREIGVRLALGAGRGQVVALVARQGLVLAALGLVIGMPCAFALTRFITTLLYRTTPADPVTMVGVPLVLGAIAALACYLPARRAARVDPVQALRTE